MSDSTHEEGHVGPIKTPKQLLLAVFFSFVVPVLVIIALVAYVTTDHKPAGSTDIEKYVLGGVTAQDMDRATAERIRKVGVVEIRDANRPLAAGQQVYAAQCASCHAAGVAGAPKIGDAAVWANRLASGLEALVTSALKGKGAMPPQAGGDYDDIEIARAVVYMTNSAGATFAEPQRPAAPAATAAAPAGAAAPLAVAAPAAATAAPVAVGATAAPAITAATPSGAAAAPGTTATTTAAAGAGQALYNQNCMACHAAGVANAPKTGDKASWAPRLAQGMPVLVQNAIQGKGAMPPKGGSTAPDADIRAAVEYMVNASK